MRQRKARESGQENGWQSAYPNGLTTRYTYDSRDRVVAMTTEGEKGEGGAVQVPDFQYGYDPVGNRTFMVRSDEGRSEYSYDRLYQLAKAGFPGGGYQEFTYDPAGNRLRLEELEEGTLRHTWYEYNASNELVRRMEDFRDKPGKEPMLLAGPGAPPVEGETTYGYDGNGARVSKVEDGNVTTYAWDPQERLLEVRERDRAIQKNSYDPYARRTILEEQGGKKVFLYDGSSVTNRYLVEAPTKGQGSGTRNIWLGGSLVAVVSDGQTWCLMADALGSVVAVTNPAGEAIRRNHYKPFGEASSQGAQLPSTDTAGFVGGLGVQADAATGLSYMWHRYCETPTGMFLSSEPLMKAGLPILPYLDRYSYANANPLRWTDCNGLDLAEAAFSFSQCMADQATLAMAGAGAVMLGMALTICPGTQPAGALVVSNPVVTSMALATVFCAGVEVAAALAGP